MMRRFWLFTLGLLGLIVVDRWLKSLALAARLPDGQGRIIDLPIGKFIFVKNDSAVFSWPLPNALATDLMIVALLGLLWFGWRAWRRQSWRTMAGVVLMIVGAASNLYDRVTHGFVIDWAYLGPWWPVFNLADVMIGVGLVLVILPRQRNSTPKK